MAQVAFPPRAEVTAMDIEPWHPGQIALGSAFTGSVQVLNRGYASWRGSVEFAATRDEAAAQSMEAFFASLGGRGNWCDLPLNRPTVSTGAAGGRSVVANRVTAADGTMSHRLPKPLEGIRVGCWLTFDPNEPRFGGRVFIVRAVNGLVVTLDPQIPLGEGWVLRWALTIRARAQSAQFQPMRRTPDEWGPWRFDWQEAV